MKRFALLGAAICLVAALTTACGGSSNSTQATGTATATASPTAAAEQKTGPEAAGGPTITMPFFTFGASATRNVVSSASVGSTGGRMWTTSPLTVPFVDGDHGNASNFRFAFTGEVMKPVARPGSQPMPRHVNGSRCALVIPQSVIVLMAQSAAAT